MIVLLTILTAAGLAAPPSHERLVQLNSEIRKLEAELAKEPIQKSAPVPIGSAQCIVYSASNIAKVEKLLKFHEEARTADVLLWREHLAWMYENCDTGPANPWMPLHGSAPAPQMLPRTRGLERAFELYDGALKMDKAREMIKRIAEAYEQKYLETGDESLLMQARQWRQEAGESLDSIRGRHQSLEQERFRKRPRQVPRPKVGRVGTEDFLRARFIFLRFYPFLYTMSAGARQRMPGVSYYSLTHIQDGRVTAFVGGIVDLTGLRCLFDFGGIEEIPGEQ